MKQSSPPAILSTLLTEGEKGGQKDEKGKTKKKRKKSIIFLPVRIQSGKNIIVFIHVSLNMPGNRSNLRWTTHSSPTVKRLAILNVVPLKHSETMLFRGRRWLRALVVIY